MRKFLGITIAILGIALILLSSYIKNRIEEGTGQVSDAQKKVSQGNSLFSIAPGTKSLGQSFTGAAQKKIDAAKEEIAEYTQYASWIQTSGIILIVIGAGILLIHKKH